MTTWMAPAARIAADHRPPTWPDPDATWDDVTAGIVTTSGGRARLARLAADLDARGQVEPVRVHPGGCDPDDETCTGAARCCPPAVVDGVHRVVLALLREGEVLVTDEPWPDDDGPTTVTTLVLVPPPDHRWPARLPDLLSHRAGPQVWLAPVAVAGQGLTGPVVTLAVHWDGHVGDMVDATHRHVVAVADEAGAQVLSVSSVSVGHQG